MDLLIHRRDVFAEQQPSGAYFPVQREITEDDIAEHLDGMSSYGVYVVQPGENTVKYVVFDLDTLDPAAAEALCWGADNMVADASNGIINHDACLREFSGKKGTHVWLFLSEPVPAEKVRRWIAADFMPYWQAAAQENGWPVALEVFPKQDTVGAGYGNLVKLPLGIHRVSGARSELEAYRLWPTSVEDVTPLDVSLIPDREAPARAGRSSRTPRSSAGSDGPHSPFACVDSIMRDGVGQGVRDNAMFHLALYCYGHGLDEDLAQEVCERANENFDPPMKADEVRHKVESAYTGRYESARCGADWLADICPGPCNAGWRVKLDPVTPNEMEHATVGSTVNVEVIAVNQLEGKRRVTVRHPDADNSPTFTSSGKKGS